MINDSTLKNMVHQINEAEKKLGIKKFIVNEDRTMFINGTHRIHLKMGDVIDVDMTALKDYDEPKGPVAGQIWKYERTGTHYKIIAIGEMKVERCDWIESVVYSPVAQPETVYTRDMVTFLTKFKKVQ